MTDEPTNKGGRGKRSETAIHRIGIRPPRIRPEIARLLDAIATARGGSKSLHLERAIMQYATLEEVEASGLVAPPAILEGAIALLGLAQ